MVGCIRPDDRCMVATTGMEPFHAGRRQEASHHPRSKYPQVLSVRYSFNTHVRWQPPYILFFSLFMICAGLTLPRTSGMTSACPFQRIPVS